MIAIEIRLGIERVHVADAAGHEHEDDPFGFRFEMRPFRCEGIFLDRHEIRDQSG